MENLQIDENGRNVLGAITNDASELIKNLRVNPITGRLLVDANIGSTNTSIGSTIPGGTAGSILFLGLGSTLAQDNQHLFFDDTNNFVGFGTNTPSATLDLVGTFQYTDGNQANSFVIVSDSAGNGHWEDLSQNAIFVSNLVANNSFTTQLANNTNFITTLANNNAFITALTANSTFITDISTNVSGLVAVATDATLTGDGTTGNPLHVVSSSSLTLETNGTPNGDQTLLNLKNGTNITITDDGVGGVTIDATGGTLSLEIDGTPNGDQTLLNLVGGTNITLTDNGTGSVTIDATGSGFSPLTTKGDIYTYSTTDTRLPVGIDGQILSSDSTQTTGLKWIDSVIGGGGTKIAIDTTQKTSNPSSSYTVAIPANILSTNNGIKFKLQTSDLTIKAGGSVTVAVTYGGQTVGSVTLTNGTVGTDSNSGGAFFEGTIVAKGGTALQKGYIALIGQNTLNGTPSIVPIIASAFNSLTVDSATSQNLVVTITSTGSNNITTEALIVEKITDAGSGGSSSTNYGIPTFAQATTGASPMNITTTGFNKNGYVISNIYASNCYDYINAKIYNITIISLSSSAFTFQITSTDVNTGSTAVWTMAGGNTVGLSIASSWFDILVNINTLKVYLNLNTLPFGAINLDGITLNTTDTFVFNLSSSSGGTITTAGTSFAGANKLPIGTYPNYNPSTNKFFSNTSKVLFSPSTGYISTSTINYGIYTGSVTIAPTSITGETTPILFLTKNNYFLDTFFGGSGPVVFTFYNNISPIAHPDSSNIIFT